MKINTWLLQIILFTLFGGNFLPSIAQNTVHKIIPAGLTIVSESSLRSNPDTNSFVIKKLESGIPFRVIETKTIIEARFAYYWYKVVLNDFKTTGWITSKECHVSKIDSIDYINANYLELYYFTATQLMYYQKSCFSEKTFQYLLVNFPDRQIPIRDYDGIESYINCKIGVLKNLAELYSYRGDFQKAIESLNKLQIQKEANKQDILYAKLKVINIFNQNLKDTLTTTNLCHDIIIHNAKEVLVEDESNVFGDVEAAETIVNLLSHSSNTNSLLLECKKILAESTNPIVTLIAQQGIVIYYVSENEFDLAETIILEMIKKYPKEILTYFKTDVNYSLYPLAGAIESSIKIHGNYSRAISLVENVKNSIQDSVIINYANFEIAQLLDNGNGDKEEVINAYSRFSQKYFMSDPIDKKDISPQLINSRIENIKSFKSKKFITTNDLILKPGLQSKIINCKKIEKGNVVESIYSENKIIKINGNEGNWIKVKLSDGLIGWIFSGFLKPLNENSIFKPEKINESFWAMEGSNSNRTAAINTEMIYQPCLVDIIHNISSVETVFSDINDDNIQDIIAYSSRGLTIVDGMTEKILWLFDCNNGSIPLIKDSTLYIIAHITDGEYLFALNKKTGSEKWKVLVGHMQYSGLPSSPSIIDTLIYIGTRDNGILAIDFSNGKVKWEFPLSHPVAGAIIATNKFVYFQSRQNSGDNDCFYALDALTGKLLWKFDFLSQCKTGYIQGAALDNGKLYCGGGNEFLYAINAENGNLIWKTQVNVKGWRFSTCRPSVNNEIVYFAPGGNDLYAISCKDGAIKWKYNNSDPFMGTPAIVNGSLYIRSIDSYLHAISSTNGQPIWKYKLGSLARGGGYSVSIAQGKIFISSTDDNLYIIGEKNAK